MIIQQDIRGERVILSQYYEKDISKEYLSWLSDKEINRFLEVRFTEYSEALAKEYVKSCIQSPNIYFLKIVSSKGDFIGTCTITYNENHRTAEIGLMLGDKDFHSKGIGTEMTMELKSLFVILPSIYLIFNAVFWTVARTFFPSVSLLLFNISIFSLMLLSFIG